MTDPNSLVGLTPTPHDLAAALRVVLALLNDDTDAGELDNCYNRDQMREFVEILPIQNSPSKEYCSPIRHTPTGSKSSG
jgi:hypothetical protein